MHDLSKSIFNRTTKWFPRFKFPIGFQREFVRELEGESNKKNEQTAQVNKSLTSLDRLLPPEIVSDLATNAVMNVNVGIVEPVNSIDKFTKPFSLLLIQNGPFLIVDSLVSVDNFTFTGVEKLASTILDQLAVTKGVSRQLVFKWPMSDHQYAPRDKMSAQKIIHNLLLDFDLECAVKEILICGDVAQKLVLRDGGNAEYKLNGDHVRVVLAPRLSSILHSPSLKSELWLSHLNAI